MSLLCAIQLHATTFTVSNTNNTGAGSFRQAIISANTNPGPDRIEFRLAGNGPFVIAPLSVLPPLTEPVTIDATTQPGYANSPVVELSGIHMGTNADALQILGGQSVVRGLAITHAKRDGIRISGPRGTNVVEANFLGMTPQGLAAGNAGAGVTLYRSAGNVVGGTDAEQRNYIAGGNWFGVYLVDAAARNNRVIGNNIGVGLEPTRALSNHMDGVVISGAPGNFIGVPGAGNVISGNGGSGVFIYNPSTTGNATNNVIAGNSIGIDALGQGALGNAGDGVTVLGVANNQIGGTEPGAGNVISGNNDSGISFSSVSASNNCVLGNVIGADPTGTVAVANKANGIAITNAPNNRIGGADSADRNLISGNKQDGVAITGTAASGNCVQGNFIGLDATGTKRLPNAFSGVHVESPATVVGGAEAGDGNVISGNAQYGLVLGTASGNCSVQGNLIGTDSTGKASVGNGWAGLLIQSSANAVGGLDALSRNIVSANTNSGILIYGIVASNNVVQGNYVGVDRTGTLALGNGFAGISISNAPANVIGGPVSGQGNVLSANGMDGLSLAGKSVTGTTIQGNRMGTDATGTQALGNGLSGIYLFGSSSNLIGGTVAGAGNFIGANRQDGIFVTGSGANSNTIQGNFVGVAANGTGALGNLQHNIELDTNVSANLVGGSVPAADNRIAYAGAGNTGYDGIRVRTAGVGNFISRNIIYGNGNSTLNGLGIDVGVDGVSTNGLPVITSADSSASQTVVQGTLKAAANTTYLLQFYANTAVPISGYGEGLAYVGSQPVTTDSKGSASFSATLSSAVPAGQYVTATATDPQNSTSEFSKAMLVSGAPQLSMIHTPLSAVKSLRAESSTLACSSYTLAWPASLAGYTLFETTNLTPPVQWKPVTNIPNVIGGTNEVSIPSTEGPLHFYQLRQQ